MSKEGEEKEENRMEERKREKIPLCKVECRDEMADAVTAVIESGWYAHGPKVKAFEEAFARYVGVSHAVSLNSCASALQVAIMASRERGAGPGEIIVPSFTFPASANAIVLSGCTPVFADIVPDTFNINPDDIEARITDKTVGIMPVHYAGQVCDMGRIMNIARRRGLFVVEDSAETLGSTYEPSGSVCNKKMAGSFGIGCFSFYPTKNITTGEGGMLTTNDGGLAELTRTLRGHGVSKGAHDRAASDKPWERVATMIGHNFRMNEVQAAMGLVQLSHIEEFNDGRRRNAGVLNDVLAQYGEDITTPAVGSGATHTYQMYVITLAPAIDRDEFVKYLRANNVEASVHFYPPLHHHPAYARYVSPETNSHLPVTEDISRRVVTLPMFPSLAEEDMVYMSKKIGEALTAIKK